MPEMRELPKDGRVHLVQGPMCRWRMASMMTVESKDLFVEKRDG